jgi:phosphomethylpyrimidine synthase
MIVCIKHPTHSGLTAGAGEYTRVMALIGMSCTSGYDAQVKKIDSLAMLSEKPDIIADLSIVNSPRPLWQHTLEAGCLAAALPIYTAKRRDGRIDPGELLDITLQQMEAGVGLLTIHPTPTHDLIKAARTRMVPWTSRGGGLVIEDLLASHVADNVYVRILPEIVGGALRYGTVLSIGASFRSANIFDALDEAQQAEIDAQLALAAEIAEAGVGVVIESPGHARPADIQACSRRLAKSGFPIMPLGPIPTDAAIGFDHVAAAIGATLMGIEGAAHILAAVTREEHTGGIPTLDSTIEAVRAARVAAHVIDIHQIDATELDARIVEQRVKHHTCIAGKQTAGCSRCGATCPLINDYN